MLLGNLRRAVVLLQQHSIQNQLRSRLLAWRDWAERRRYLARSVADRLQGRYLGGVWEAWRQHVQLAKLGRSQGLSAMVHFTSRTSAQVSKIAASLRNTVTKGVELIDVDMLHLIVSNSQAFHIAFTIMLCTMCSTQHDRS